jgi:hypothetical protein
VQLVADEHSVSFTSGSPDTVLPALPDERRAALAHAEAQPTAGRVAALRALVARWPDCIDGWASLAEVSDDPVEAYAFARVGYHRGLDALRGSGWRGSGYVRWRHEENRGFLRALDALGQAARRLGEDVEADRCAQFLRQLDPNWPAERER